MKWAQLCGSLNILWLCFSLGLEWKLTFSSPMAMLSLPYLLAYWVQYFHSIIFQDLNNPKIYTKKKKRWWISRTIFKNKERGFSILYVKTYYKNIVIKTGRNWYKDRQILCTQIQVQRCTNIGTENSIETNPHINDIFHMWQRRHTSVETDTFSKCQWSNFSYRKGQNLCLTPYTKF